MLTVLTMFKQIMPTPIHDVAHTDRSLLLMSVLQFIEDTAADFDDNYGNEVAQISLRSLCTKNLANGILGCSSSRF